MIYFVQAANNGPIKIGTSTNEEQRIRDIRTACPFPTRLIATIPGDRAFEARLHRALVGHRSNGEWFHPNLPVQRLCRAATISPEDVELVLTELEVERAGHLHALMSMEPIIRFLFGATLNILVEQHGVSAVCKAARLHDDSIRRLRRGIGTTGVTHLFFLKEAYPGSFDAMDDLMGGSPAEVVERLGHLTTVEAARDAIDGQLSRLTPKAVAR